MFYEINNKGQITRFADFKFSDSCIKSEIPIVTGYDGQAYFLGTEPQKPEPTYAEKRAAEYPAIGDQLDMIYWDKVNNTDHWQQTIAAVKEKYPKEAADNAESTVIDNFGLSHV